MVDVDFLSRVPLFASVPPDDLGRMAHLWTPRTLQDGQVLFSLGGPARAVYVIRAGKVIISAWTDEHEDLVLAKLSDGDFFGELAVLDGSPQSANARVAGTTELLEMSKKDFLDLLNRKSEVSLSVMTLLARRLRQSDEVLLRRASRNVNEEMEQRYGFGDRLADRMAQFGGSWSFIIAFAIVLAAWMLLNSVEALFRPFDPYPFIFLNLVLSCLAAIQAPIIMMSQNRQSLKDRLHAELDYRVNLKAELQIQGLHAKLDEIRGPEIHDFNAWQRERIVTLTQQIERLHALLERP
jgi:uncharacterized membrane protein